MVPSSHVLTNSAMGCFANDACLESGVGDRLKDECSPRDRQVECTGKRAEHLGENVHLWSEIVYIRQM